MTFTSRKASITSRMPGPLQYGKAFRHMLLLWVSGAFDASRVHGPDDAL
jgi:hypothetical protein